MNLAKNINRMLAVGGIQIQRAPCSGVHKKIVPKTSGTLVELFGVSGVGKSHFFRMLSRDLKEDWHLRGTLFSYARSENAYSLLDDDEGELVDFFLKWKHDDIFSRSIPLSRKIRLYDFYLKFMAADIVARKKLLPSCGCFFDDSTTRLFSEEVLRWHDRGDIDSQEVLRSFMKSRCIVLFDAPDQYIVENLKRRHQEVHGKLDNDVLAFMNIKEAMDRIRIKKHAIYRCFSVAESLGVPTLVLDASDQAVVNSHKLKAFIKSVSRQGRGVG